MTQRILIVDDDIASVSSARRAVAGAGFDPVLASNGPDAEAVLAHEDPALVLLGLQTAGGTGPEILQTIRELATSPTLPILVMGDGQGPIRDTATALAHGADGYFERPADWAKVVAKVESYLGMAEPRPKRTSAAEAAETIARAEKRFAEGDDELEEMFAEAEPELPAELGGEAGEGWSLSEPGRAGGLQEDDLFSDLNEDESEDSAEAEAEAEEAAGGWAVARTDEVGQMARQVAEDGAAEAREAEETAKREAEETAKREAEETAKREAEETAKREAEEEEARREAEEKAKREAEETAKREAEEEAKREAEEKAKREAEEEAKREAEEKAKRAAEEKAKREAEEKAKREAEEKAKREAEQEAKRAAEEKAKREAEEKAKREAEEKAKRAAEEKAKREAEEEAKRAAEEEAKREAEEKAKREAEEAARREAEEAARREAEEAARREAEEAARREAEEAARREAEEAARREAEEAARREAEAAAQVNDENRAFDPAAPIAPLDVTTTPEGEGQWVGDTLSADWRSSVQAPPPPSRLGRGWDLDQTGLELELPDPADENLRSSRLPEASEIEAPTATPPADPDATPSGGVEAADFGGETVSAEAPWSGEPFAPDLDPGETAPSFGGQSDAAAAAGFGVPEGFDAVEEVSMSEDAFGGPDAGSGWEDLDFDAEAAAEEAPPPLETELLGAAELSYEPGLQGTDADPSYGSAPAADQPVFADLPAVPTPVKAAVPPVTEQKPPPDPRWAEVSSGYDPFDLDGDDPPGPGASMPPAIEPGSVEPRQPELHQTEASPALPQPTDPWPTEPDAAAVDAAMELARDVAYADHPSERGTPVELSWGADPIAVPLDEPRPAPARVEAPPPPPARAEVPPAAPTYAAAEAQRSRPAPPPLPAPAPAPELPVEPALEPTPQPGPAPFGTHGSLLDLDFPRLLAQAWHGRATGVLEVRGRAGLRRVFFEVGRPVGVHSDASDEQLAEVAWRLGRITRDHAQELRREGPQPPRRQAVRLVEQGRLKAHELYDTVRAQAEAALFGAFSDEDGAWRWLEETCPADERVALPEHPYALVTEGIRRKFPLVRIHRRLGGPATLLVPADGGIDTQLLGFSARERRLAEQVDGLKTAEELVFISGLGEEATYQVLFALYATALAEVRVRGPMPEGRAATPDQRENEIRIDCERLEEKFRQAVGSDYFEVLGLASSATSYEVRSAWERLSREFHPSRFTDPAFRELWGKLEEIRRALDDAYDVLKDDGLRVDYLNALERGRRRA